MEGEEQRQPTGGEGRRLDWEKIFGREWRVGCSAPDPDLSRHADHVRQRGAARAVAAPRDCLVVLSTRF